MIFCSTAVNVFFTLFSRVISNSKPVRTRVQRNIWKVYAVRIFLDLASFCHTYLPYHTLDIQLLENDIALGNSPAWFGEWSLTTFFQPTDEFLRQWADAQKLVYSKSKGWIVRKHRQIYIPRPRPNATASSGASKSKFPISLAQILHGNGKQI